MAFSQKDTVVTLTPAIKVGDESRPIGSPIRLFSFTRIAVTPGGKTSYLKGADMLPIDILIGTAEPKLEIECSDGREVWDARKSLGGIGSLVIPSITFARVGMQPRNFLFPGAVWGDGGGLDVDETKGAAPDRIVMPCVDILDNLVSIFNRAA